MAADKPDFRGYYQAHAKYLNQLKEEVEYCVDRGLPEDLHIHSRSGRVKGLSSFLEKIERKGYTRPDQVEDLVGYRIVCLSLTDLTKVQQLVWRIFNVLSEEDKIDQVEDASSFGYMSMHYICTLKKEFSGPRYDDIKTYRFELQCRTILMDAWANVSHYLAYKGEVSIPEQLRRDFHALSGLFYVADRHFELFFEKAERSEHSALSVIRSTKTVGDAPMNLDTVHAMLKRLYPERTRATRGEVSVFLEQVASAGYSELKKLENALVKEQSAAERYEADWPPDLMAGKKYSDVGFARMALAIFDLEYAKQYYSDEARFEEYRTTGGAGR